MCSGICMFYACVFVCMCVYMDVWRSEVDAGCFPQLHSLLCFETVSLILELINWLSCLVTMLQGSACFSSSQPVLALLHMLVAYSALIWEQKIQTQVLMPKWQIFLPNEPPSKPNILCGNVFISLGLY